MAEQLSIRNSVAVKRRSPLGVLGLSLLTLGIYPYVWYYKVNRELRDYGETFRSSDALRRNPLEVDPVLAVLAVSPLSIFLFFIPACVSTYHTACRVLLAEELAGSRPVATRSERFDTYFFRRLSPLFALILPFFAHDVQTRLNRIWDASSAADVTTEPGAPAEWHGGERQQGMEPTAQPTTGAETKTCPDCAEEVKAAALVCRFCGYRFEAAAPSRKAEVAGTSR